MITDRSYVAGLLLMFLSGAVLVAGMALTPPLLQQIYNYGVLESGYLTGVRGIAAMFAMIASGRLVDKFDVRWLLLFGVLGIAASLYVLSLASLEMGPGLIIWSSLLQGAGVGFVFIPIQAVAFASVPPNLRTKASSMFNLSRNFGGSVAVAIVGSLLARGAQVSHADLSQYVNPQNMPIADPGLIGVLGDAGQSVMVMIEAEIMRQSLFLSYLGDFRLMMWASLAMLPLILLADFGKGGKKQEERTEHPVHLD